MALGQRTLLRGEKNLNWKLPRTVKIKEVQVICHLLFDLNNLLAGFMAIPLNIFVKTIILTHLEFTSILASSAIQLVSVVIIPSNDIFSSLRLLMCQCQTVSWILTATAAASEKRVLEIHSNIYSIYPKSQIPRVCPSSHPSGCPPPTFSNRLWAQVLRSSWCFKSAQLLWQPRYGYNTPESLNEANHKSPWITHPLRALSRDTIMAHLVQPLVTLA